MRARAWLAAAAVALVAAAAATAVCSAPHGFLVGGLLKLTYAAPLLGAAATQLSWDAVHLSSSGVGGAWGYDPATEQWRIEGHVVHKLGTTDSVLEVGCHHGYLLERLQRHRPEAAHAGLDVSAAALDVARTRCAGCEFARLDVSTLARGGGSRSVETLQAAGLRGAPFDMVLVPDVLFYVSLGLLPPVAWLNMVHYGVGRPYVLKHARLLLRGLQCAALKEVLLSHHDFHKGVLAVVYAGNVTWNHDTSTFSLPGLAPCGEEAGV
mmetsp:Transcript_14105/g.48614  ORF Transcript_14105/g.48614 Transcript_14105/m.48614 type:complete len:266 (+) Transcript_14105:64-861(+)